MQNLFSAFVQIESNWSAPICQFIFDFFWEFQTEQYRYDLVLKMEILTCKHQGCEFQTCFAGFPLYHSTLFSYFFWEIEI